MANNSSIEWTETTWNPLAGCTRASAGCDNCYAAKMSLRLEAMAEADISAGRDPGGKRKYIGIATKNGKGVPAFNGRINLDEDELQRPYSWKKPRLVFVNSMSDLFHKDVPDRFILSAFDVMRDNPQHTFQVLTKRPDRMADFGQRLPFWPENVWAMTSVENQEAADERIPHLLRVPAAVRGLSCEPLLGPVDITDQPYWDWRYTHSFYPPGFVRRPIDWVIVGGESGPNARPMHPGWARSLRDQCRAAGVKFFFKQWGEWVPSSHIKPGMKQNHMAWPWADGNITDLHGDMTMVFNVGKKAAGRLLDGREWNEWPK